MKIIDDVHARLYEDLISGERVIHGVISNRMLDELRAVGVDVSIKMSAGAAILVHIDTENLHLIRPAVLECHKIQFTRL